MNLSRTVLVLLGVLVVLTGVSTYLWFYYGTGQAEVDHRIADTLQNFTCDKCGHTFTMTMAEVSYMRRTRLQIYCPKCGEGGAHKDLMNRTSAVGPAPAAIAPSPEQEPAEPESAVAPNADRESAQLPETAPGPTSRAALVNERKPSASSP